MPNESFIEGANRISVDIRDRVTGNIGALVGPGPISTCLSFSGDWLLNQAGTFTARFPGNDPRLAYLQLKAHRLVFQMDGVDIFYGIAERWDEEIDSQGQRIAIISGRDELGELAEVPIKFFTANDEPETDIPERLVMHETLELNGVSWGYAGGDTETAVYGDFAGETVLSAITRIAERVGESFRLEGARTLRWLGTSATSSGVRAIQAVGDPVKAESNPYICFIQSLAERRDATRMITTVYPTGAGLGETQLDTIGTSRTAPAGFTYDETANSITSDAAVEEIGFKIGRRVNFKEIRPLFNTDADVQYAKDYLFDTALAYLQRNDSVDDFTEYDIEVAALPMATQSGNNALGSAVLVGDTIRVIYQDEQFDLDDDFVVLGIRIVVDRDGAPRYTLTIATTNQWHLSENNETLAQVEEGQIFTAHPQIDANSYWMPFREEVGDSQTDHIAEFPFWLSAEVVTIRQVLFRYKVDRILTGTNSYAYADSNTGGPTSADTGAPSVSNTTEASPTTTGGTSVSNTTEASPTTTGGTSVSNTTEASPTTTGGTSVSNTTEASPTTTGGTSVSNTTEASPTTTSNASIVGDPHTHEHSHVHPMAHTHEHSHVHPIAHTHEHSHVHPIAHTHEHSHVHPIAHTHEHSHVHSIDHTHTIDHAHALPTLVGTFSVQRVPALNSYTIFDLEYSINGGTWNPLTDGINVAGGYAELDITSEIQAPGGLFRPLQEYNVVEIRRTTAAGTGKTALIRAQIGVRCTIQSIVVYS